MENNTKFLSNAERRRINEVKAKHDAQVEREISNLLESKLDQQVQRAAKKMREQFEAAALDKIRALFEELLLRASEQLEQSFDTKIKMFELGYTQSITDQLELFGPLTPDEVENKIRNIEPVALQFLEDIICGKISAPTPLRAKYADKFIEKYLSAVRNESQENVEIIQKVKQRTAKAQQQDKQKQRMEHAKLEASKLGISPQDYLDEEDLKYFTLKAPDDHALELVALAHIHRDYSQLEDDGYEELDAMRKGDEAKYALNYIKELRTGVREYQYVITSAMFESDSLEMNDSGQIRF